MATSGTFAFLPSVGELVLNSYARIQKTGAALTQQHWYDAQIESNFLQIDWANRGVNLWTVDLQTVTLQQGVPTYSSPTNTVAMLDTYISIPGGSGGGTIDRWIPGWSREDYAAQPNKTAPGPPTAFWFDRLISPTITLWPVPDGANTYTLNYYRYRMIQDAVLDSGIQPEIPWRWLDAWSAGLAHRLARIHAPPLEQARKLDSIEAWRVAATQDVQNTPLRIQPGIHAFYRRVG